MHAAPDKRMFIMSDQERMIDVRCPLLAAQRVNVRCYLLAAQRVNVRGPLPFSFAAHVAVMFARIKPFDGDVDAPRTVIFLAPRKAKTELKHGPHMRLSHISTE